MIITQAIRQSDSESEVYALLTHYLEAVGLIPRLQNLSAHAMTLPIMGIDAVSSLIVPLRSALELVSKRLDDQSRGALKEALYVFGAALEHLEALRG